MFKMKKVLGILLAVCFLVSITATAASAGEDHDFGEHEHHDFGEHGHHHFHPGHWEKHRFDHREFWNNCWTIVYEYKEVYVNGFWAEY